jgi:two-component system alkaline phosphatase synthesis response regulator PhoP
MTSRILLVEDEPSLVVALSDLLADAGYDVETATDGDLGLTKATSGSFDLVILDVMLPRKSGFDVCRELRQAGADLAVLMLTAKTEVTDRVTGLKSGADDYLAKPFYPSELLARVEAMLRRIGKESRTMIARFRFGEIQVNFDRAELLKSGQPVSLAGKEFQLLKYLIDNRQRVISREELLQNVWEYHGDVSTRTLDVHVAWLRQKIEENPQSPKHIHTIRGKGYRFSV